MDSYITGYNKINQGDKKMKRSKRAYKYIKEELESQQITLKKVKIIDTVSEYATIDRIDGMLSLASEIGLMNNKKIKKINYKAVSCIIKISRYSKIFIIFYTSIFVQFLIDRNSIIFLSIHLVILLIALSIMFDFFIYISRFIKF